MGFAVTIMAMTVMPMAIMAITVTMRMNMVQAMFHPMNHTTRAKEKQRLEKGVGNQVEEGRDVSTGA